MFCTNVSYSSPIASRLPSTQREHDLDISPDILVNRLSFSHFIELINCDTPLKRDFYETEAIA
jgi:hypothetical protein